jgi:hypothetical protein
MVPVPVRSGASNPGKVRIQGARAAIEAGISRQEPNQPVVAGLQLRNDRQFASRGENICQLRGLQLFYNADPRQFPRYRAALWKIWPPARGQRCDAKRPRYECDWPALRNTDGTKTQEEAGPTAWNRSVVADCYPIAVGCGQIPHGRARQKNAGIPVIPLWGQEVVVGQGKINPRHTGRQPWQPFKPIAGRDLEFQRNRSRTGLAVNNLSRLEKPDSGTIRPNQGRLLSPNPRSQQGGRESSLRCRTREVENSIVEVPEHGELASITPGNVREFRRPTTRWNACRYLGALGDKSEAVRRTGERELGQPTTLPFLG